MSEANTALRAKGEECSKLAAERDLLAAQLAEPKELLKKTQKEAEEEEAALLAEFTSERSSWTDKEAMLASGFHEIEDLVDGELLCFPSSSCRLHVKPTPGFFLTSSSFFPSWQSSSPAIRRQSHRPSRLIVRHGGKMAWRSLLTPP